MRKRAGIGRRSRNDVLPPTSTFECLPTGSDRKNALKPMQPHRLPHLPIYFLSRIFCQPAFPYLSAGPAYLHRCRYSVVRIADLLPEKIIANDVFVLIADLPRFDDRADAGCNK